MGESGDVARYQQYFNHFAVDGLLNKDGFRSVLQCLEMDPPQCIVDEMFAEHDKDENSQLNQDEFYEWIKDRVKSKNEMRDSLMQSLDILFPESVKVKIDDLLEKLSDLGEQFDESEASYARMTLEEFDSNNDGCIDKAELMNCFYSNDVQQHDKEEPADTDGNQATEDTQETADESGNQATEETQETVDESGNQATEETQETVDESGNQATEETQETVDESGNQATEETQETVDESGNQATEETQETVDESGNQATEETQETVDESGNQATEETQETVDESGNQATEETQETVDESGNQATEESQQETQDGNQATEETQENSGNQEGAE